jgi:transcriptional regulator with XRE-family HTH domain
VGNTTPVGQLLRELRERRGESLRGAAKDLGVDPSYLSKVERGSKPLPERLKPRIADYYDADPEELTIAEGLVPVDIAEILLEHPEVIAELRERYGSS